MSRQTKKRDNSVLRPAHKHSDNDVRPVSRQAGLLWIWTRVRRGDERREDCHRLSQLDPAVPAGEAGTHRLQRLQRQRQFPPGTVCHHYTQWAMNISIQHYCIWIVLLTNLYSLPRLPLLTLSFLTGDEKTHILLWPRSSSLILLSLWADFQIIFAYFFAKLVPSLQLLCNTVHSKVYLQCALNPWDTVVFNVPLSCPAIYFSHCSPTRTNTSWPSSSAFYLYSDAYFDSFFTQYVILFLPFTFLSVTF